MWKILKHELPEVIQILTRLLKVLEKKLRLSKSDDEAIELD